MTSHKFWTVIHGGSTHFPIALILASVLFDLIAFAINNEKLSRDLRSASFYSLILGAVGSFGAVLSGVMLTQWQLMGHGALKLHHLFVWPAFGGIVALAVWRIMVQEKASRPAMGIYVTAAVLVAVLMTIAGYWGGELI